MGPRYLNKVQMGILEQASTEELVSCVGCWEGVRCKPGAGVHRHEASCRGRVRKQNCGRLSLATVGDTGGKGGQPGGL